jgi:hypothetical protein
MRAIGEGHCPLNYQRPLKPLPDEERKRVDPFKNPYRLDHRHEADETRFLFGKSPFEQVGRLS